MKIAKEQFLAFQVDEGLVIRHKIYGPSLTLCTVLFRDSSMPNITEHYKYTKDRLQSTNPVTPNTLRDPKNPHARRSANVHVSDALAHIYTNQGHDHQNPALLPNTTSLGLGVDRSSG